MSELNKEMDNSKLSDETLAGVAGGKNCLGEGGFRVNDISPIWVKVTADVLNCRYFPDGEIAKTYTFGHQLKVNGITSDGLWYRLLIYNPKGGECDGYIYKAYTQTM